MLWILIALQFARAEFCGDGLVIPGRERMEPIPIDTRPLSFPKRLFLLDVIEDLNRMVGPGLAVDGVRITDWGPRTNQAITKTGQLQIDLDRYTKRRAEVRANFAHEWGHFVFADHLVIIIDGIADTFAHHELRGHPSVWPFRTLLEPYSELFCDLVAALDARDPDIMRRTEGRSFRRVHPLRTWTSTDRYEALDPARSLGWRIANVARVPEAQIPALLQRFLRATAIHVEARVARGTPPLSDINREFLRLLFGGNFQDGLVADREDALAATARDLVPAGEGAERR